MKQRDLSHLKSQVPKGPQKDRSHMARVANHPCLICKTPFVQVHHLRELRPRTMGVRVGDEYTVPLCVLHHDELHACGGVGFWQRYNIDPEAWAKAFYAETLKARR